MPARSTSLRDLFKKPKRIKRKRLFVDSKLQGMLIVRVIGYWLLCQSMTALLLYSCKLLVGADHLVNDFRLFWHCAVFSTAAFLPLAAYDALRLSHRFAGPMVRFRRALRDLGRGQHVEPIRFREGDYWQDLAKEFNAVLDRFQKKDAGRDGDNPYAATADEAFQSTLAQRH